MTKCFLRSCTCRTGAVIGAAAALWRKSRSSIASPVKRIGAPAGGPVGPPLFLIGRILPPATVIGESAAWRKDAAGRQVGERRHHARDFHQSLIAAIGDPAHEGKTR